MKKLIWLLMLLPLICWGQDHVQRGIPCPTVVIDSTDGLGTYPVEGDSCVRFLFLDSGMTEKGIVMFHIIADTLETADGSTIKPLSMMYRPISGKGTKVADTLQAGIGQGIAWTYTQIYKGPSTPAVNFHDFDYAPGIQIDCFVQMNGLPWAGMEVRWSLTNPADGDCTKVEWTRTED